MANAEALARGAPKASYTQAIDKSELAADFALGQSSHFIRDKYQLSKDEYDACLATYVSGQPLPDLTPRIAVVLEPDAAPTPVVEVVEAPKPEFHYTAQPRHDFVFLIRLSKEHSSRVIVPAAHQEKSDLGIVWAIGPEVTDLKVGNICLFDKYACVGQSYELLNEDGDMTEFLMLQAIHICAILKKEKTREYR